MRKLLIAILLLIPSLGWAEDRLAWHSSILGGGVAAAINSDSCTDGLLFSYHLETADTDTGGVAGGVNNGCVVTGADHTGTLASSAVFLPTNCVDNANPATCCTGAGAGATCKQDGSTALWVPTSGDNYGFDWTNNTLKTNAGTVSYWIKFNAVNNNASHLRATDDANNRIALANTTTQVTFTHKANSTDRSATSALSGDLQVDTWYHVVAKWDTSTHSDGTYNHYQLVCVSTSEIDIGTDGGTGCNTTSGTSAPDTWTGDNSGTLFVGDSAGFAGGFLIDNLKIYDSWK